MTKAQSIEEFANTYYESVNLLKAHIKDGVVSKTTVRCEYLDFVDYLAKDHRITEHQRMTWCAPSWMY